jgi:hypothetical protein
MQTMQRTWLGAEQPIKTDPVLQCIAFIKVKEDRKKWI